MRFGPDQYVPVLKVKRGEKKALQLIAASFRPHITPLLEIVERKEGKAVTVGAHLKTAFKDLADSVSGYTRCFLDPREIAHDGASAAAMVYRRAVTEGIVFTPVTGFSRTADVAAALAHRDHGVALRLTRNEFEAGGLAKGLRAFMSDHGLAPEDADLIVDLGAVDNLVVEGMAALTGAFLAEIPDHSRWRTMTVSACAFPLSMKGVERRSHALVERSEWVAWKDALYAQRNDLPRLPTFSDCGIQHPKGVEGFDFKKMQVSAAIRYTTPGQWLLVKGESTRHALPSKQFPGLANQLVHGGLRSYYAGPNHCAGCASMQAAADGAPGFGSAAVWRCLGTIHHVTSAVEALGSLPWP